MENRTARRWSKEEDEYLKEYFGVYSTPTIAKHLDRTVNAVVSRAYTIFKTRNKASIQGYYTATELNEALGVNASACGNWIHKRNLPAIKYGKERIKSTKQSQTYRTAYFAIDLSEFWNWLKENKKTAYIKTENVNLDALSYIPDWFMEDYKNKKIYGRKKFWSEEETKALLDMSYKENKSIREIAKILDRTMISVRKKLEALNDYVCTKEVS